VSAASAQWSSRELAQDSRRFGSPDEVDALTRPMWASRRTISWLIIDFGVRPALAQ
jgi:hypothetical protein